MDKLIGNNFFLNQAKNFPINKAKVENVKISKAKNEAKDRIKVKKICDNKYKVNFRNKNY